MAQASVNSDSSVPEAKWLLFPNGKMWQLKEGQISGTVVINDYEASESLEERLDKIAEAATGSTVGLEGFSYANLGNGIVQFCGALTNMIEFAHDQDDDEAEADDGDPEDDVDRDVVVEVVAGSKQFIEQLVKQYGMMEIEAEHAAQNLDNDYGDENTVELRNGREIKTAAFPEPASYVRVCIDGLELSYWVNDEWHDKTEDVMGAFIGAMKGSLN